MHQTQCTLPCVTRILFDSAHAMHTRATHSCLRSGWKGIWEKGEKVIGMLDKLTIWPVTIKDGKQKKHVPGSKDGSNLLFCLKRLWDFVVSVAHALEYAEPSFVNPPPYVCSCSGFSYGYIFTSKMEWLPTVYASTWAALRSHALTSIASMSIRIPKIHPRCHRSSQDPPLPAAVLGVQSARWHTVNTV